MRIHWYKQKYLWCYLMNALVISAGTLSTTRIFCILRGSNNFINEEDHSVKQLFISGYYVVLSINVEDRHQVV
jgi:hypothetical protein